MRGDMKKLILLPILFLLCSCSVKYVSVKICPEVAENGRTDIYIDTTGSTLTTTTDQTSEGQLDVSATGELVPNL